MLQADHGYNRENFFFDGEQRIKREYQGQLMRVKQFELFREDIRDLMELTVAKMDNYLIVNTIQIGLVVVLFTEGRPEPGVSPPWLLFLWAASGVGSFMYITLCIWLAMHASICSHSFCVRMLTQLVRLPIPSKEQMDAARVLATDFEGVSAREMLRVPVVKQQLKKLHKLVDQAGLEEGDADASNDAASDPGAEETMLDSEGQPVATDTLSHVKLYRRMQANWQAYDAYARVSMAMGTNQFLQQLGYTCLIGFVSENGSVLPGMCSVLVFSVCAALLVRLDLYVSSQSLVMALVLNTLPSFIAGICLILTSLKDHTYLQLLGDSLVPVPVFLHIVWLLVLLLWAQGKTINGIALPTTFRAVLYLDVFGWLSARSPQELSFTRQQTQRSAEEDAATGATASFRLSVVREEEPLHSDNIRVPFLPSPGSEEGRRGLKTSLARKCRELKSELQHDLGCFEHEGLASLMSEYDKEVVNEMRQLMDRLDASLQEAAPEARAEVSQPEQPADVWVQLEWNTAGHGGMPFYRQVNSEDSSVVWTKPPAPAKVLDMYEVRQRLGGLEVMVQMLVSEFQAREEQESIASVASSSSGSVLPEPSRPAGSAMSTASSEVDSLWHNPPDLETGGPSSQEPRFGGGEAAVQLTESEVGGGQSVHSIPSEVAGGGFHPHRLPEGDRARQRDKEPGRLPWSTIQQGSLVLIAAWSAGFVWTVLRLLTDVVDILKPPVPKPAPNENLELVFDGPWPQFFEPQGMACQLERGQPVFWLQEKFAVHQLAANDWTLSASAHEAECLSQAPQFHAAGLRGISMQCSDLRRKQACSSMLVGTDGNVLLCNRTAQWISLHSGTWQVAASSDTSGLWAKRTTDVSAGPAFLQDVGGTGADRASRQYVSTMELGQQPVARTQEWMDVLEDGGLIALSGSGVLHAWRPTSSSTRWLPSGWSFELPSQFGLRWRGFCTVGQTAFFLGKGRAGRVELWKMELPASLRN
ncbi:unnamed protein product [Symbiodinium natans]|uniref:Uncharacterized protein n=1 Tax=Symbiodinium natans TaxID=878477 RepID=A0A812RIL8_9DINO|nr:unnamed protein product [Symbiodinium natans]